MEPCGTPQVIGSGVELESPIVGVAIFGRLAERTSGFETETHPVQRLLIESQQLYLAPFVCQTPGWYLSVKNAPWSLLTGDMGKRTRDALGLLSNQCVTTSRFAFQQLLYVKINNCT